MVIDDNTASGGRAIQFGVGGPGGVPNLSFKPSGAYGFGTSNVLAYSPFKDADGKRPLLMGVDIAGFYLSLDGGKTWTVQNVGTPSKKIASIVWSSTTPGVVYSLTDGGLVKSTDWGRTWTKKAGTTNADSNGDNEALKLNGYEHPRPVGVLTAHDDSGSTKYLYVGTATQGIKRSTDDGASYDRTALVGSNIRGIALDPSNPDRLFVAVQDQNNSQNDGVFMSTNARGNMTFTKVSGSRPYPQELTIINGTLYVAFTYDGIYSYNYGNSTWQALNNGVSTGNSANHTGPRWMTITGYRDSATGQNVLYAGCVNGSTTNGAAIRSLDGGATWKSISRSTGGVTAINNTVYYGTNVQWWYTNMSYARLHLASSAVASIVVNPDDRNNVVVTNVDGATAGVISNNGNTVNWYPAHVGTMLTVNNMAFSDPKMPNRVYQVGMDIVMVMSNDYGQTYRAYGGPGQPNTGDVVSFDTATPEGQPSAVYVAASRRGDNTGQGAIYSNPDPIGNPSGWVNENLPVVNDPQVMAVGRDANGTRIILAFIQNDGLWRKSGNTWTKLSSPAPFGTDSVWGNIVFRQGTPVVYAHDRNGLWRSDQAGAQGTWVKLLNSTAKYQNAGAIAVDPTNPNRIYLASVAVGGVVRVDNAHTSNPTTVKMRNDSDPGPIAVDKHGALYMHVRSSAELLYIASPGTAGTLPQTASIADSFYKDNNFNVRHISVGANGYVYTSNNSSGTTIGIPQ